MKELKLAIPVLWKLHAGEELPVFWTSSDNDGDLGGAAAAPMSKEPPAGPHRGATGPHRAPTGTTTTTSIFRF